jgi:hypothetical protein
VNRKNAYSCTDNSIIVHLKHFLLWNIICLRMTNISNYGQQNISFTSYHLCFHFVFPDYTWNPWGHNRNHYRNIRGRFWSNRQYFWCPIWLVFWSISLQFFSHNHSHFNSHHCGKIRKKKIARFRIRK